MSAGYSGKPLIAKLGIKPGFRMTVINPPDDYATLVAPLPDGVSILDPDTSNLNCIHLFSTSYAELVQRLGGLRAQLVPNGMLWVSWPKRSSGVTTDLSEDSIRALALSLDLVDVKVCAVDTTWSALKLVIPIALRAG
jgi:hypothetical protein